MTDYYHLMTRAIASLDPSTGGSRRALYERARDALVESLRNVDPRLSDSEITQQRLSLEQAIRDVEADAVRRLSVEAPQPGPVAKSGLAQEGWDEKPAPAGQGPALGMPLPEPESQPVTSPDAGPEVKGDDTSARQRRARAAADARDVDRLRLLLDKAAHHAEGAGALRPEAQSDGRWPAHVHDGSRELEAVREPSSTARRPSAGMRDADLGRSEPRLEPHGLKVPRRERDPIMSGPHLRKRSRSSGPEPLRAQQASAEAATVAFQGRSKKALISAFLSLFIVLALVLALYWLRDPLKAVFY